MAIAGDTGKPSVNINEDDTDVTEELGEVPLRTKRGDRTAKATQLPPSTVYSESIRRWKELQELRQDKREELQNEIAQIKSECEKYGIDFTEVT